VMSDILLIEDDAKIAARVKEALREKHKVESVLTVEALLEKIRKKRPALLLIDFDLKETDGLQVFLSIKEKDPSLKVIMLSSSGNIPLAVKATKLGVTDFIHKPFPDKVLQDSVESVLSASILPLFSLKGVSDSAWFSGTSKVIRELLASLKELAGTANDVVLIGEAGINARAAALLLHKNSIHSRRRFVGLDLRSFRRESAESHFWGTIQELLTSPNLDKGLKAEEDLLGTLFIEGLDLLREHFSQSVLEFLKKRKSEKRYFKEARIILSVQKNHKLTKKEGFESLRLPPLRERKEDIISILNMEFPKIKYISPKVSNFFMYYDFPGNYEELYNLARGAFYGREAESLDLKDLPLNLRTFARAELKKIASSQDHGLIGTREKFEADLLELVLEKTSKDLSLAARFLEVPKTVLCERIQRLGIEL